MSEGKVTIRDVAREAGVSPSTVSRAFARPDRVSAATATIIFDAANRLGYHSEPVQTVPLRGIRGVIAVIVPDIANQFLSDVIRAVQHECDTHDYALIVAESRESASMERTAFDRIAPLVDGAILTSSRMPDAMIRKCAQTRPIVSANRIVRGVDSVVIDINDGVEQLADHIQRMGFDRVTYLDGPATSWSVGFRWHTVSQACAARGIAARRLWPGAPTVEGGFAFAGKYLDDPTGMVVAHNDLMAVGFMAAMRRQGRHCPQDYSIAGFDNDLIGQISQPTLTTVRQSPALMGTRAARILFDRLKGERPAQDITTVPTSLIIRESTRRPGGEGA
ncbi:LacI family DNA-binding transcriptional regulator [Bifidobacterium eulemuris]|uniref:LacI family DNA-binding transcriptional regulator n=1 Tax=Bifidobacterium eulemuris TaxID=1765219 RepID=A0A261G7T0_9BIFI|nr:LacI family DNA-binding transcriptional regulator [Bifidobacterium eulemuris]OZG67489.1 LacI family transcriptional regulator [Bifidobacterium eulemuris]QOL31031.1 LacI family DNA-binding transcriptional regulator [Bifidobacterium eulemuris]QOL33045.1 LacI family DNA-binding transcriptional regulator [Bifidobacterium eulemuris]